MAEQSIRKTMTLKDSDDGMEVSDQIVEKETEIRMVRVENRSKQHLNVFGTILIL